MAGRLKIAALAWFFGMLLAIPTAIAVLLSVLSAADFGGRNRNPLGVVALIVWPALASMALSKVVSGITFNLKIPEVREGPTVIGFAAGLLFSIVAARAAGGNLNYALVLGCPLAGAMAGTCVDMELSAVTVGAAVCVLGVIAFAAGSVLG